MRALPRLAFDAMAVLLSAASAHAQVAPGCLPISGRGIMCSSVMTFQRGAVLPGTTVAGLSATPCNASRRGMLRYVTDATAPAYNAALTGGGAVVIPVFCNGAAWTAH